MTNMVNIVKLMQMTDIWVGRAGGLLNDTFRRVLIASANPLFGKGLRNLFQQRWGSAAHVVGLTKTMQETFQALDELQPDLVIVDYDDRSMNREEFLNHFVASEQPMQLVLMSLQSTGAVVVYDRRTLSADQAEKWLGDLGFEDQSYHSRGDEH
jgi:cytochrome c oxidase subunit 2